MLMLSLPFKRMAFLIQRQQKEFESMSILQETKRPQMSCSESSVAEILTSSTCWPRKDWFPKKPSVCSFVGPVITTWNMLLCNHVAHLLQCLLQ
jgi:hypothetical protein